MKLNYNIKYKFKILYGRRYILLGQKLKRLRKSMGFTQSFVASKLGITLRAYVSYESNSTQPRTESRWNTLAKILGVSVNYLKIDESIDDIPEFNQSLKNDIYNERIRLEKKLLYITHQQLEKKGYLVQETNDSQMIDLIAISPKRESIGIEVKIFNNIQNYNEIINFYGRLAILRSNFSLDKLLLVTNEKCIVEIAKKQPPINLKIPLLISIVDLDNAIISDFISII